MFAAPGIMATTLPPCSALLHEAVESFNRASCLNGRELKQLRQTSFHELQKDLALLQKEQQRTKRMMHMKRLLPFLDSMQCYTRVIELAGDRSNCVAYVWGSMRFLLQVTSSHSDAFNELLDAYLKMGLSFPPLAQYTQAIQVSPACQKLLASVFGEVLELHQKLLSLFKQREWEQLFYSTWRTLKATVAHVKSVLQSCREIFQNLSERESTGRQGVEIQSFEWQAEFHANELQNTRSFGRMKLNREQEHRHNTVQQWLCATNSELRQTDSLKRRFDGTGNWLLRNTRFQQWFNLHECSDPLLWLKGIPGAGKTVLASLIIQEAQQLPNASVAFFYCKHSDEYKNGFLSVARGILSQLVKQNDALLQYLYEIVSKNSDVVLSKETLAIELLERAFKCCSNTYVVIDGIDEYSREDRKMVSSYFRSTVESIPKDDFGTLRCLFVSQDDGYARKDFRGLSEITVTAESNRQDISTFCEYWHQTIEAKFGCLNEMQHSISKLVTARSQGMFLFARLVTWNLHEQENRENLENELDRMPQGLDQLYDRILERIYTASATTQLRQKRTQRLLGWLTCAKRPLKWYEIQGAMALDLGNETVDPSSTLQDDCKDICASLVEIGPDQSVLFVHSTVKKYLVQTGHVDPVEVEIDLANICLEYLSSSKFDKHSTAADIESGICSGFYAFSDYAIAFWALHLENCLLELHQSNPERFEELATTLELFLDEQCSQNTKPQDLPNKLKQRLMPLERYGFYTRACSAIVAQRARLRPTGKTPIDREDLWVLKSISRMRAILEGLSHSPTSSPDKLALLEQLYGPNRFKCERLSCHFFYHGFPTESQREQHVSKHERAFTCSEEGCPQSIIGCITAKDLEKHMSNSHGIRAEEDDTVFPDDQDATKSGSKAKMTPPTSTPRTFQCRFCPKQFTKFSNMVSHLRTHTNERPYICRVCGNRFSRRQDCKRHEELHLGEKNFVCQGVLKDNNEWGCGRRFTRADALSRHHRSEAGRVCIRPLLEEEEAEKRRDVPMQDPPNPELANQSSSTSSNPFNPFALSDQRPIELPEALPQQYPALRGTQWDSLPAETMIEDTE